MAASYQSATDAYNRYMAMVQSGMSPMDAVQQSGLVDLRQQQLKAEGRAQQRGALGQVGGAVIGKLGIQAGKDFLAGEKILGGLRGDIANAGTKLSEALGLGGGSNVAQTAAQNAAWNAQAGAAQNAAWNAGADAATSAVSGTTPPPTQAGIFAPGSGLMTALGGAGAALGAYGAYKGIEAGDPMSAGLGGAGVAGGLSAMGLALGPIGWAGLIAAPIVGALINKNKVTTRERNQRQTENLLKMGFTSEQMQALGRMDAQGNIIFRPDTLSEEEKEAEGQKWKELTSSRDPNVNPLRQATGMWGTEGMLSTYGPDYLNKMSEFDRYVATASAIEKAGGFYNKKGEVLLRNQDAAKAAYEEAKNTPELLAKYQEAYNTWKSTGQDVGIDWNDQEKQQADEKRKLEEQRAYNAMNQQQRMEYKRKQQQDLINEEQA